MNHKDLLLAIDNGTQSLKALVFDPAGRLIGRRQVVFEPYVIPRPGWAEQDPEVFWQALCTACQGLWQDDVSLRERIAGVAVTTQRSTVINLDASGRPLRPAIVWLDQRRTYDLPPLAGLWGMAFRLLGLSDTISYFRSEAESNWIRMHQPEIWAQTRKYLLLSGYLNWRLTGRFVDSAASIVAYLPFDYKRFAWAPSRDWKWQAIGISPDLLPELVPPTAVMGQITAAAAAETGIPAGLPVVAAAADKACEVIGSGGIEPHVGCLSYGTTATINVTSARYVEPVRLLPPYPSAAPGRYSLEVMIYRGYWMVGWFKKQFGQLEEQAARMEHIAAEELFDRMIADIPPGSMGLVLQPYWSPGLKSPGPEAKGAVIGFGDVHTRGHLYRAILEGLAYALREGKERIERRTRIPVTELRVSGGGSQSRQAMQATADVFGLPAARPRIYDTSGLGAAIDLAVGLGVHADIHRAVAAMTRIRDVFEPDPERHARYDALYRGVYLKLYRRLKPLYKEIRRITGYPG
jgi:sugar (pentulose or hexulose) kinase